MVNQRFLVRLAIFACFFALCVIGLGAFTRLIDAGLGCPDWPGCYGHLTAPIGNAAQSVSQQFPGTIYVTYKAWAEMVHRYFAGTLSLLIMSIVGAIFFKRALRTRVNLCCAVMLLLLIAYQIMLGQWTVTLKLLPIIVTQHLLGGFLILSTLWLVRLNNMPTQLFAGNLKPARSVFPFALLGLIFVFGQIFLGAWTSTNYASLSCPDFPFCVNDHPVTQLFFKQAFNLFSPVGVNYEGGVLSTAIRQTIQMTHRFGALFVTIYLFFLLAFSLQKLKKLPALLKPIHLVFGLLVIQLCLGITNVVFKLPVAIAVCHNLTAALLLLSMITFVFKLIIAKSQVSS